MPADGFVIESHYLGLVAANEISDLKSKINQLGELAEKHILIDQLIEIAERNFYCRKNIRTKLEMCSCK